MILCDRGVGSTARTRTARSWPEPSWEKELVSISFAFTLPVSARKEQDGQRRVPAAQQCAGAEALTLSAVASTGTHTELHCESWRFCIV